MVIPGVIPGVSSESDFVWLELCKKDDVKPSPTRHILGLAQIIREVDGTHQLGAAALAEAILGHPDIHAILTAAPDSPETTDDDPIRDALDRLVFDIDCLVDSSSGVAGLHLNGDIAPWAELMESGRFSSWVGDAIAIARAALAAAPVVKDSLTTAPQDVSPTGDH